MTEEHLSTTIQEWHTAFDAVNDAIWIVSHDRCVLRANKTAGKILNIPTAEMIGKHCWEILGCSENATDECPGLRSKNSKAREKMELRIGDEWFQVAVDPILAADGRYRGAVHIARSITEHRKAEQALRESEQKFRILTENTIAGVFISQDKKIVYANDRLAEMHGYSKEEEIGRPYIYLFIPMKRKTIKARMEKRLMRSKSADTRIVRIFNTYGPRMRLDDGRVVPNFIQQALRSEPLTVFGNGLQTRSFCYVDDLVDGIYRLLQSNEHLPVNIGNPDETSILDFAKTIIRLTGNSVEVDFSSNDQMDSDPQRRRPDINRAKMVLNWEPTVGLEEGLARTIAFFKEKLGMK